VWALPVLIAVTFHEAAHGLVASRLGDDTARMQGRVTLNPLKHVDPFGTIILPALLLLARAPFLFGYAKPVPVRFKKLNNPRRDMVLVAAAGPAMNLALAIVSAFLIHAVPLLPDVAASWAVQTLVASVHLNVVLAVFNMLPLPPLDGGRVAVGLLPAPLALPLARLERWGMLLVIGLLLVVPALLTQVGLPFRPLEWLVGIPVDYIVTAIATIAGLR
jgi:Zn-dependent protease